MDAIEAQIVAPLHRNSYLAGSADFSAGKVMMPDLTGVLSGVANRGANFLGDVAMKCANPDIVHQTYFSASRFRTGKANVLTVYDMIYEKFPHFFEGGCDLVRKKRAAVENVDHVICISESTRSDLIELFDVPVEKTSVVYLGVDEIFLEEVQDEALAIEFPFVLFVGSRGSYKNFELLLDAFSASERLKEDFGIICFGGGMFTDQEREAIARAGLKRDRVLQMSGHDSCLRELYSLAEAFVYPSLYEGFGIPPLEAMSCGCPVVTSNTSSLPEVVGDAAELVDPESFESVRNGLEAVLYSDQRKVELNAKGRANALKFSWKKCAQDTYEIYKRLSSE